MSLQNHIDFRSSFLGLDLRSIGLFRIIIGLNLLFDFFVYRLPYIHYFYTPHALVGIGEHSQLYGSNALSIFNILPAAPLVYLFFAVVLAVYILYTLGYKSTLTSILTYFILWNIQRRFPHQTSGWDDYLNVLLFWSMFLPLNARFSLFKADKKLEAQQWMNWGAFAVLLQIAWIYLTNFLSKTGALWEQGRAVDSILSDMMLRNTSMADWLLQYPDLCYWLSQLTLVFEAGLIFLLFLPFKNHWWRLLAAISILFFHWGISLFVDIGSFAYIATAAAVLLVPAFVWDKFKLNGSNRLSTDKVLTTPKWQYYSRQIILMGSIVLVALTNFKTLGTQSKLGNNFITYTLSKVGTSIDVPMAIKKNTVFNQSWKLYSPNPVDEIGWIVIGGVIEGQDQYVNLKNELLIDDSPPANYFAGPMKYALLWPRYKFSNKQPYPYAPLYDKWLIREAEKWMEKNPNQTLIEANINLYSISRNRIGAGDVSVQYQKLYSVDL